jgi:hypothetical protein
MTSDQECKEMLVTDALQKAHVVNFRAARLPR